MTKLIVRCGKTGKIKPEVTPEQWQQWMNYKSNKDRWIEENDNEE